MGSQKRVKTLTKPKPVYHSDGESLSRATVEAIRQELVNLHSDAISITVVSERLLEALGFPVESAVRLRVERRNLTRKTRKRNI